MENPNSRFKASGMACMALLAVPIYILIILVQYLYKLGVAG
ncbi:hypothetical protein [Brackiella oedipodis]|nr:hypothetical protein [Brackiella oedipodis]